MDRGSYNDTCHSDGFDLELFANDVDLLWKNALDYNRGDGTPFGAMAKILQWSFKLRIEHVRQAPRPSSQVQAHNSSHKRQRIEVYEACGTLPLPAAVEIIDHIAEACPGAVQRRGGDSSGGPSEPLEMRVNLDKLDDALCETIARQAKALAAEGGAPPS